MAISPAAFHRLGDRLLVDKGHRLTRRQFIAFFGCSPRVCAAIWNRIERLSPSRLFTPGRLLWTLMFLKLYSCEDVLATIAGCTRFCFRKWVWYGIDLLCDLDLVSRSASADRWPSSSRIDRRIASLRANASFYYCRSSGNTGT